MSTLWAALKRTAIEAAFMAAFIGVLFGLGYFLIPRLSVWVSLPIVFAWMLFCNFMAERTKRGR